MQLCTRTCLVLYAQRMKNILTLNSESKLCALINPEQTPALNQTSIWISHRGLTERHTENTHAAFSSAIRHKYTHFETDLRTTSDGHIVLIHDPHLSRLAGAQFKNLAVETTTRSQLQQVRLRCGEPLLFFDEFLQDFTQYHWILDIKPESALNTVHNLLKFWQDPAYENFFNHRVRFLFWHKSHQQLLLNHHPSAVCMANLHECRRAALACQLGAPGLANIKKGYTYAVPAKYGGAVILNQKLVQYFHQRRARVLGYLPRNHAETRLCLAAGVDEILIDGKILT